MKVVCLKENLIVAIGAPAGLVVVVFPELWLPAPVGLAFVLSPAYRACYL
jgi:hypothetical protein